MPALLDAEKESSSEEEEESSDEEDMDAADNSPRDGTDWRPTWRPQCPHGQRALLGAPLYFNVLI